MKRRVVSFLTALALCLSLCPTWALAAADDVTEFDWQENEELEGDLEYPQWMVSNALLYHVHTYKHTQKSTTQNTTAFIIQNGGKLFLRGDEGGQVDAPNGVGIEVQPGGYLRIDDSGLMVSGEECALNIASGATVQLAGGTFKATDNNGVAIQVKDDKFADLLKSGYAYFDGDTRILPSAVKDKKTVSVKECTDHLYNYTHNDGKPTHDWVCDACGAKASAEKCTFEFGENETATCVCGNKIAITVDESTLGYNSTEKTIDLTVALKDSPDIPLVEDTDYTVAYKPRIDVGEITVTVTGKTYNGTFTRTYYVTQDQPVITWNAIPKGDVYYDGNPVEVSDLPGTIEIRLTDPNNKDDLSSYIKYSYRYKNSDTEFTEGLPTNAGTYEIKASLSEQLNYKAAETNPCLTLKINKIPALITAPMAIQPTYNRNSQKLVTSGSVQEGAKIEFDIGFSGNYATDIPTAINAGSYTVRYKIAETENYTGVDATIIPNVKINPKKLDNPTIDVREPSYVFDGSTKNPTITVRDGQQEIEDDQYTVTWSKEGAQSTDKVELRDIGKYTATIKNIGQNNNYVIDTTADVEIVAASQDALSITGKPEHVYYGDTVRSLTAVGGTGNGAVKWSVDSGPAEINETTGELKIIGMGSITVKAERTVSNHEKVEATCNITVEPKPVTAVVTVDDKEYDGGTTATVVKAVVQASDLVNNNDAVTISGLKGTFENANVGTNKTVTLDKSNVSVGGADKDKYNISYPDTATASITQKSVTVKKIELSGNDLKKDNNGTYYYDYDSTEKKPDVTVTTEDGTELSSNDYTVNYSNNKNFGTATVTVQSKTGSNYTFAEKTTTFEIREVASALTSTPLPKDLTYNGKDQELVTGGTATGGQVVYSLTGGDDYSPTIPKGRNATETYTVYYKVKGDDNHTDTTPALVYVTIKQKTVVSPDITLPYENADYTGTAIKPKPTSVKDGDDPIPASEYNVTYSNNLNVGTATVNIVNANGGNYIVNGSKTFEITKVKAEFDTLPGGRDGLSYDGAAQPLITAGTSNHGTVVYSLDKLVYTTTIPTRTDRGDYKVYAKVRGDANHTDSEVKEIPVTIDVNNVTNPTIELSSSQFVYNGSEQKPTITVKDDKGKLIPSDEYDVEYTGNTVNVGTYTITIKTKKTNSNYSIAAEGDKDKCKVEILAQNQTALTITGKPNVVYYGDTIQLGTTGGSGNGTVTWSIEPETETGVVVKGDSDGQFKITGVGSVKIKATRTPEDTINYKTVEDVWTFYAYPKPVTAEVTAEDREFDKTRKATVTATVPGTNIEIKDVEGTFDSEDVGTNKTVTINPDAATVTNGDNYEITYPKTTTASIRPAPASKPDVTKADGLTYTGDPLQLVTPTSSTEGDVAYSLDGVKYSLVVPTGTDAKTYRVWYKVIGKGNYTDSDAYYVEVTITPNTDIPTVLCTPNKFSYDGTEKMPTVTVKAKNGKTISPEEYELVWPDNRIAKGTYTVTVKDKSGGNYEFAQEPTGTYEIVDASENPLVILSEQGNLVKFGDEFSLSTQGGSGDGAIQWSVTGGVASLTDNGTTAKVKVTGTGNFTVTARKASSVANDMANTYSMTFVASEKTVTPTITVDSKPYDKTNAATLHATWADGVLVDGDVITITLTGEFVDENVATNKSVKITGTPSVTYGGTAKESNYNITYPTEIRGTISQATADWDVEPGKRTPLTYTGGQQALVTAGTTKNDIGIVEYKLEEDEDSKYSTTIPTGEDAGTYTVCYRVPSTDNYEGILEKSVDVVIDQAMPINSTTLTIGSENAGKKLSEINSMIGVSAPGEFSWEAGNTTKAEAGVTYNVTFTPTDTNYKQVTIKVTVASNTSNGGSGGGTSEPGTDTETPTPDESGDVSVPVQAEVKDGIATASLSAAGGNKLVQEAVANESTNVVIQPKISSDVTKTEVSLPASTVSQLGSKTNAALTVSTPIADVTIPNASLDSLSSAEKTVSVATEQVGNTVALTLSADGQDIAAVSDGLTLTVPVEEAVPGTVAMLVKEDGTREVIPKSIVDGEEIAIPLDGSATVEIVDNSKDFDDVADTNWAADAVAFASAHELFNGTSETTFSPEAPMSRAMLATVLYNLEGHPESVADLFDDVDNDAWYADSVAWTTENGITTGYEDGNFYPNENITREQLAVMLWRYAGSPEAEGEELNFTDADQASSYALDALRWATAKGIINGYDDGQLNPGGMATRAQAAQMLKNFLENS